MAAINYHFIFTDHLWVCGIQRDWKYWLCYVSSLFIYFLKIARLLDKKNVGMVGSLPIAKEQADWPTAAPGHYKGDGSESATVF